METIHPNHLVLAQTVPSSPSSESQIRHGVQLRSVEDQLLFRVGNANINKMKCIVVFWGFVLVELAFPPLLLEVSLVSQTFPFVT